MNYLALTSLRRDFEILQQILIDLSVREEEIGSRGFSPVIVELNISDELFNEVAAQLIRLMRSAESFDPTMIESLKELVRTTNVQDALPKMGVMLRIAKNKKRRSRSLLDFLLQRIDNRIDPFHSGSETSIPKTLDAVSKLLPALKALEEIELNRQADDDPLVKPSRVDRTVVGNKIDAAIDAVTSAEGLDEMQRATLVRYLTEAKAETKKERPIWKKVIGALVITATVLQGIAAAPTAVSNLKEAVQYITNASLEPRFPLIMAESPIEAFNNEESKPTHSHVIQP